MSIIQTVPTFYSLSKTGIQKLQTYGFIYLSQEAVSMLNDLISLYDNCEVLIVNTALSSKQEHDNSLQEAIANAQLTGNLSKLHSLLRTNVQEIAVVNSFYWYKSWNQSLQKDNIWKKMDAVIEESSIVQKNQLAILQANWRLHGKFSHYSLETLLYAAYLLALIEEHIQAAYAEFKSRSHKMLMVHQKAYKDYLAQSLKVIKQEEQYIAAAMLARLQLMREAHDLKYTDITVHTIKQLKNLGVLKPETSLERQQPAASFSAKIFLGCHRYISEHSNIVDLPQFFNLVQSDKTVSLVGKTCATQYVLVPAHLISYVPAKPARLPWLSRGHQLRYQFFSDKAQLLLTLALLTDLNIQVTDRSCFSKNSCWLTLKNAQQQVDEALKTAQKQQLIGWWARFQQTTSEFLTKWQETMREQQQMIIQHQLIFLEKWAAIPPVAHLFKKPAFSPDTHQTINEIVNQLERTMDVTHAMYPRLQNIKQTLTSLLRVDNQFRKLEAKAPEILEQLAQGKAVTSKSLKQLLDYYAELDIKEQAQFEAVHQVSFNIIQSFIRSMMNKAPSELMHTKNYPTILLLISQCGQLLRQSKQAETQENLNGLISQAITNYRSYLEQAHEKLNNPERQEQLLAYEKLLEQLANLGQIDRLAATQILRQTAKSFSANELKENSLLPVLKQKEHLMPAKVSPQAITEARQAFKERCLQNQQRIQASQQYKIQADKLTTGIEDTLERCQTSKDQCAQVLFQNNKLLQAYTTQQVSKMAKPNNEAVVAETTEKVFLDIASSSPQPALK